jgi:mono/diheme cytochrome c family protein
MGMRIRALFSLCIGCILPAGLPPAPVCGAELAPFLETHCLDCHDSTTKKGGLNLENLPWNPADRSHFETWVRVHDRIQSGEMPPIKRERPPEAQKQRLLSFLDQGLHTADARFVAQRGRSVYRRLTALELEHALKDLLALPDLRIKDMLPEDERRHGYNKISEALDLSNVHLAKYIEAFDAALSAATATRQTPPPVYRRRFYPASGTETWLPIARANAVLLTDKRFDARCPLPDPEKRIQNNNPVDLAYQREREQLVQSLKLREFEGAVGFFSGPMDEDWRISLQFAPVHAGFYKIRTSTWGFWWDKGQVAPPPRNESFMLSVLLPEPGLRHRHSASRRLGMFDNTSLDSRVHEITRWMEIDEELVFELGSLTGFAPKTGRWASSEPGSATNYSGPGVALDWYEVEGPLFEQWPPPSHRALFGDLPLLPFDPASGRRPPDRNPVEQIAIQARPSNDELSKEEKNPPLVTVTSERPLEDAERLLEVFLPKAFRRKVGPEEVQDYVAIARARMESNETFEDAIKEAYKAALCSPDFLFTGNAAPNGQTDKPAPLGGRALADRLALWLWNSLPDDALCALADEGALNDPRTLRGEVERLLSDPRSERFVNDFVDQWLDLRKLDASRPDPRIHPEFRAPLRESMPAETRSFLRELLTHDLSVTHLVASDFAMLNQPLAELYGIPGVDGADIRRVPLPPGNKRGGFMTQASVLKVTANGTTTSPVTRGVWMNERILGNPIPPPPASVPAIEPDTRGATTIREQLDKHRSDANCAACHAKIDPPGFALESFDVIGGFRERYRSLNKGDANGVVFAAGWTPPYKLAKPVDSAGRLPSGESFSDITELRAALLRSPEKLAANLIRQLLMYSTGSESHYSDRREVERIVASCAESQYGIRSLIHAMVQSDLFLRK